jgi:hypothetical protein
MEKQNETENGIVERTRDLLKINKIGLIAMISTNGDKNSAVIDLKIITMINCFYGHLSLKQLNWIMEKVKYITRHNDKYRDLKGIKDIQFI